MSDELNDEQKAKLLELLEMADTMRGALKTLTFIGTIIKWLVGLGASAAILWSAMHGGAPK